MSIIAYVATFEKNVEKRDEKGLQNLKNGIILFSKLQFMKKQLGGQDVEIFFGEVFLDEAALKDEGINYPIKIEYYKEINEHKIADINKAKYGINIVKKEFHKDETKVEKREIKYLTNDEERINYMLKKFRENNVTPIELDDIILDFSKQIL